MIKNKPKQAQEMNPKLDSESAQIEEYMNQITGRAVSSAIVTLRNKHGLGIEPKALSNYLDTEKVQEHIYDITHNKDFENLKINERGKFLYDELTKRIIEYKPFDERGQTLLEGSLETMVGKIPKKRSGFLGLKRIPDLKAQEDFIKNYQNDQELVRGLVNMVAKDPKAYEMFPEMHESAAELHKGYKFSSMADLLYASGKLTKDVYQGVRDKINYHSGRLVEFAGKTLEDYVAKPAIAAVFAMVGFSLILANKTTLTGQVIGGLRGIQFGIPLGIICLLLAGLLFFNRKKKF